jgi:hypothetical protein
MNDTSAAELSSRLTVRMNAHADAKFAEDLQDTLETITTDMKTYFGLEESEFTLEAKDRNVTVEICGRLFNHFSWCKYRDDIDMAEEGVYLVHQKSGIRLHTALDLAAFLAAAPEPTAPPSFFDRVRGLLR